MPFDNVQEFRGEVFHFLNHVFGLIQKVIIENNRRYGRGKSRGGGDQRFRNAGGNNGQGRRTTGADSLKGIHNAPNRAE